VSRFSLTSTTVLSLRLSVLLVALSFRFTAPPSTQIYTLSLHDALPISNECNRRLTRDPIFIKKHIQSYISGTLLENTGTSFLIRSEEHTSELQSRFDLVCRLLLEKKKNTRYE